MHQKKCICSHGVSNPLIHILCNLNAATYLKIFSGAGNLMCLRPFWGRLVSCEPHERLINPPVQLFVALHPEISNWVVKSLSSGYWGIYCSTPTLAKICWQQFILTKRGRLPLFNRWKLGWILCIQLQLMWWHIHEWQRGWIASGASAVSWKEVGRMAIELLHSLLSTFVLYAATSLTQIQGNKLITMQNLMVRNLSSRRYRLRMTLSGSLI